MTSTQSFMGIPRERIPWAPAVDADLCNACAACLEECPNGVFAMDDDAGVAKVVAPDRCVVLCDKCASSCPSEAISFPDKEATKRLLKQLLASMRGT